MAPTPAIPAPASPAVSVRVPAKINLELVVGPRREDGYHELATVFHAVALFDVVTARPAREWGVTVTGPYAHLFESDVEPDDNLAVRAATLLAEAAARTGGVGVTPVHLTIDKSIPVAAGMAGGSADAAAALVACDALWDLNTPMTGLHELAARLGSDVNFALIGGTAVGSGRGEKVTPEPSTSRFEWVVVTADEGLSTPAVFAELDRLRAQRTVPAPITAPALLRALRSGDVEALGGALANDLEEAACSLRPELAATIVAGTEAGAVAGLVSGSGPTVVFLARDAGHARTLASHLTASNVGAQVICASGPARGAHVIPGPRPDTAEGAA